MIYITSIANENIINSIYDLSTEGSSLGFMSLGVPPSIFELRHLIDSSDTLLYVVLTLRCTIAEALFVS